MSFLSLLEDMWILKKFDPFLLERDSIYCPMKKNMEIEVLFQKFRKEINSIKKQKKI